MPKTRQNHGDVMKQSPNPHEQGAHALKQARDASRRGDLSAAAHWSRVADQMSRAAERLADNPPQAEDADEEFRAELRRRVQRFVEADLDIQRWEKEREEYDAAVSLAMREGGPMPPPLRMHPAGPQHMEEAYLTAILKGREAT